MNSPLYRGWVQGSNFKGTFLSALSLPVSLKDDCEVAEMADSSRSYKSSRACDMLPSVRPSYVSLILVFVCGFLWLKNEATNDRLLTVENQLKMLPRKCRFENDLPLADHERTTSKPTAKSPELLGNKIEASDTKRLDYPSGKNLE